MSFSRSSLLTMVQFIESHILRNVETFLDVGVLFNNKHQFKLHIEFFLLGFTKCWSKDCQDWIGFCHIAFV